MLKRYMDALLEGTLARYVSITHLGQVEVETVSPTTGEATTEKRDINTQYYISSLNSGSVTEEELFQSWFEEKHFEQFLPEGTVDEDVLGELSSRIQVKLRDVVTAMLYCSAGITSFKRM
jgi:hypothetical protein